MYKLSFLASDRFFASPFWDCFLFNIFWGDFLIFFVLFWIVHSPLILLFMPSLLVFNRVYVPGFALYYLPSRFMPNFQISRISLVSGA